MSDGAGRCRAARPGRALHTPRSEGWKEIQARCVRPGRLHRSANTYVLVQAHTDKRSHVMAHTGRAIVPEDVRDSPARPRVLQVAVGAHRRHAGTGDDGGPLHRSDSAGRCAAAGMHDAGVIAVVPNLVAELDALPAPFAHTPVSGGE